MWSKMLVAHEGGAGMNVFVLDDAPYSHARAENVTEAKIAFDRPMLYGDFNSIGDVGAMVSGVISLIRGFDPAGKFAPLIRSAAGYGKCYISEGSSVFGMPEEVVPLGIRVQGRFMQCP